MHILESDQEIIYYKNEVEIGRITSLTELKSTFSTYVRTQQPRTKPGQLLSVLDHGKPVRTSSVLKVVHDYDHLEFQTRNSRYRIEYKNINIEAVIRGNLEGKFPKN